VEGSCEHGIEPSGSIRSWEVLEWRHNWRFLKTGSAQYVRSRTVGRTPWTVDQLVASTLLTAPGDCDDGGMNGFGRENRSIRRKPAPTPLCPPQIPLARPRRETRAAAVGSQRLTASAMVQPT
jgi:hypothetical protein